jgi:hypothetical protein
MTDWRSQGVDPQAGVFQERLLETCFAVQGVVFRALAGG